MDGRFVPNITIGPLVVDAIRPVTEKPLDCHLMIVEPELRVADFAALRVAGASLLSAKLSSASDYSLVVLMHLCLNQLKQQY